MGTAYLKLFPKSGHRSTVPLIDRHLPEAGAIKY